MRILCSLLMLVSLLFIDDQVALGDETKPAATSSLRIDELAKSETFEKATREMLTYALTLTEKNLKYTPASSDPAAGGMDCSGAVYHVLQKFGYQQCPRQSNEMYQWVWESDTFRAFNGLSERSFEWKRLQPGDLLFWTNTTADGKTERDPPVTHVMMYLGTRKRDGKPVMYGSSDGRTYEGVARRGVSVFDFRLPQPTSSARFIGYARLPARK